MEISKIIDGLKTGSAAGYDGINNDLLKKCKHAVLAPLTHLCNLSLSTGTVPDCLKTANVVPILKAGDPLVFGNYRPISLLTSISKILEKIVNKRLLSFLENNGILAENQFGFRNGRSTEDAVVSMVGYLAEKMDSGQKCIGVFLDLAKAFDTVSRPILLKKMESLGIRGLALQWFTSYFMNRTQRVIIGNQSSSLSRVTFGVPQGSVLGPTLFLIYINDLCKLNMLQTKILAFADDTALIFHGKTWEIANRIAQAGMVKVSVWLQNNLLTLNTTKTKFLTFSISQRTAPKNPMAITIHNCNIVGKCDCKCLEQVSWVKYLGVVLDDRLCWKRQIDMLNGRVRKLKYIFKRMGSVGDKATISLVYTALCLSILSYCSVVWGAAYGVHLIKLERAQRAILKIAFRKPWRYSTDLLYAECEVLRVRQIFISATLMRFHKNALTCKKNTVRSQRLTSWRTPKTNSDFAKRTHAFLGPYLYTKFNRNLNIVQCIRKICKMKIKKWL